MREPYNVFCCYARKDRLVLDELKAHLTSLKREELINIIDDIDITPGEEWERVINHHLEEAHIILLLISSSDYCYEKEMQRAIARHEEGTACVIPIIIRPTSWQKTPLHKLQALPKDAKPISSWEERDAAFVNITDGIRSAVQKFAVEFQQARHRDMITVSSESDMRTESERLPLRNSSFEVWTGGMPTEWFCKATTGWISQVQDKKTYGNKALEIGGNTDNEAFVFCRSRETQVIPVLKNSRVKLSFSAKKVQEGRNPERKKYVELWSHDGSGWKWELGKDVTEDEWTEYETEWWDLPAKAQQVSVGVVVEKDGAFRINRIELRVMPHR